MADEISAFAAYAALISNSKKGAKKAARKKITKQAPKKITKQANNPKKGGKKPAPKKFTKQAQKQTAKQPPKMLNNGAGKVINQNGVKKGKQSPKVTNMSSSNSSSSLTEISNESSGDLDDLETTADMARQMAELIDKCAAGAGTSDQSDGDSDDDASEGSDAGDESDDSDESDDDDVSDESDDDDDGGDSSDEQDGSESEQFSVEYTPNESTRSESSIEVSPVAVAPPPKLTAAQRRKAQKRSIFSASDEEAANDLNNNNNKGNTKKPPIAAKQQKLQQNVSDVKRVAISCPFVRPDVTATALKTSSAIKSSTSIKSCPLPSKELKAETTTKLKNSMAANAKSCPLPKKTATAAATTTTKQKQQSQQSKQQQQKSTQTVITEKQANAKNQDGRRSFATELTNGIQNGRRSLSSAVEPPKSKVAKGLEQSSKKEVHLQNSMEEGKRVLYWLLNPITPETFFNQYWERNACQVMRKRKNYFSKLISFEMIDEMLIHNHLEFTTNIDVTSYENGVRQTHNPDGRAMPPTVWGFYEDGCSIRILNPSTYLKGLNQVCTVMQEYFHCLVGANVYLTPPYSQGFAPHYDDIEAFVLQVEGRKRWRLYTPPLPEDTLGRVSSGNYKQEELGEPIFDAVLSPGDILYFPRGTVHQAVTQEEQHSLHITLSVYQQQAYANLLEELVPKVLQRAIKQHLTLRRGLPLHTWQHLGLANGGQKTQPRTQLIQDINQMVQQYLLPSESQIDAAVDQLAKRFQHEALPPVILPEEKERTVFGSRSERNAQGHCLPDYELTEDTEVRLLRANILRLVAEEKSLRIYYYVDNALEYRKYEANFMEIRYTEAPAVEAFIKSYPKYLKISELPLRNLERRIEVATALWERGLLMTKKPFKIND